MDDADLELRFAPDTEALAGMRRELGEWLTRRDTPIDVVDELVLAAEELCANAIEAAVGGVVHLEARCDGSAVHLAVSNAGHAPDDLSRVEPIAERGNTMQERGRGLMIVRAVTDSLAIVNVDGHTVARAVRLLDP